MESRPSLTEVRPVPQATTLPKSETVSETEVQLDLLLSINRLLAEAERARSLRDRWLAVISRDMEAGGTIPSPAQAPRPRRRSTRG